MTTPDDEAASGPIMAIAPPDPKVRAETARLIVGIVVRRTLADLGLLPKNDNEPPRLSAVDNRDTLNR